MNSSARASFIHGPLFVTAVFGILIVGRALSLVVPTEFYFTFQSLFADRPNNNLALALVGKMLAPAVVGALFGAVIYRRHLSGLSAHSSAAAFLRRLRRQWTPTVFAAGFFAAFLSAWPIVVYWDLLSNPEVSHLKYLFFVLYVLYMLAYGYMALLGTLAMIFVLERLGAQAGAPNMVSLPELSRVGALWLLNSGLASAAMEALTK